MAPKHPQNFSANEVAMWLVAIGLGSKVETFKEAGVDGSMLVILGAEDFAELGLSGLQGKKLMTSLEFSKSIAEGGGGSGGADPALVQQLQDENMALKAQLEAYQQRAAPAPAPTPPPAAAPAPAPRPPPQPQYRHAPR